MSDMYSNEEQTSLVTMSGKKLLFIALTGVVAGVIAWGLTIGLDTYVYKALLCKDAAGAQCASSTQYAAITAMIIGAVAGLIGLVRLHVYRPLLIVLASFISLWGLLSLISPFAWYLELLTAAILYGLSFGIFAWVARIRHFVIAIIVVVAMAVAVRLILNS